MFFKFVTREVNNEIAIYCITFFLNVENIDMYDQLLESFSFLSLTLVIFHHIFSCLLIYLKVVYIS